jgi:hypothetical protein
MSSKRNSDSYEYKNKSARRGAQFVPIGMPTMVLRSVYFMVKFRIFTPELWDFIHQIVGDFSYVAL